MLSLGARPFHLGLLAPFLHLDKVARLGGAELMRHTGKAGIMLWGRLLATPVTAGLAVVVNAFRKWVTNGSPDPA